MNINDTLQYLNIGLPDDIARRKAWGDFEGAIRLIDLRLAQDNLSEAMRACLTAEREIICRIPQNYPFDRAAALAVVRGHIPDFTEEEFDERVDAGKISWLYVNGEMHFLDRFFETLCKADPSFAVRAGVQVVRLPKTDCAQDVIDCEREIARIERESGIPVGTTGMMAAIESANGVLNAAEIARASNRLIGIALGAEDYVTDLKTTRSDGIELLFARCMILNAARAAGIAALDTVYSDVNNEEGFLAEAMLIKKLGFDGKSVINPRQIEPLHRVFMPSEKDLNKARLIMAAIEEANARGSGVASLKGKMIDKPVVTRARRLLDLYEAGSKIDEVEEI